MIVEARWYDFTGNRTVGFGDELHAMYVKALQRKQANPDWIADPQVHPWVTAMWPTQPSPGNLYVPGVRIGYALADPPESKRKIGRRPDKPATVPTLGQTTYDELDRRAAQRQLAELAEQKAIEGTIVE